MLTKFTDLCVCRKALWTLLGKNTSGLTNREFVADAYVALLDRWPDRGGWEAWTGILEGGNDRIKVVRGLAGSEEFGMLCAEYGITR